MTVEQTDKRTTILVVDDDPDMLTILRSILSETYLIRIAVSGKAALKMATTDPLPDLIMLDIMMPTMDGYAVCQRLKEDICTRDIPIIFLSSKMEEEDEIHGLEMGAVDFITKPIRPHIINARIKIHLAMRAAHLQLLALNKALADLATVDGLTGIPNRRRFDEYLMQEWNRALREQTPLSLILSDIDYFKAFNDHYGHVAGDECLRKVAQTLAQSTVRITDLTARYGGEEFSCILPNTDTVGLIKFGNQLRESIHALRIPHAYSSVAPYITISLGGTTMIPDRETSPLLLIGQADEQLYKAKDGGRNRLIVI